MSGPKVRKSRAVSKRRGYPIHAYIGANGGGKTLAMIRDTLATLAQGRRVVSTVRLLDTVTGEPHPLWTPLDDFRTMLEVEFCDLLLDEVTGVASSRESAGMPAAVANHLVQLRRRDVVLRWTAPSWKRADVIIRECSQAVTLCQGFMPEAVRSEDGSDRLWSSRRLFYWRTFDAAAFDEWSAYRKEKLRPVARQLHWRPGSIAQSAYDTFDAVLSLGAVTEAGLCMECGGKRTHPRCGCAKHSAPMTRIDVAETDATPAVSFEVPAGDPLAAVLSLESVRGQTTPV